MVADLRYIVKVTDLRHIVKVADLRHTVKVADMRHIVKVADMRHVVKVADLRYIIKVADLRHIVKITDLRHRIKVTETSLSAPSFQLHRAKLPLPRNQSHTITLSPSLSLSDVRLTRLSVTSDLLLYWQLTRFTVGPPANETRCGEKCSR